MNNKHIFILLLSYIFIFSTHLSYAAITVAVSPSSDRILPGSVRTVYSNVQGATASNVTWTTTAGTTQESNGYFIRWKAPTTPGIYTITATSVEDTNQKATATFAVISDATVKISNIPSQVTAYKNQPVVIQSILWGSTNTAVSWKISGGTLTGIGREVVFSADTAGTYTIKATSVADSAKTATTTVVVTNNEYPTTATAHKTQPVDCTATGSGTTYNVSTESEMDAVPWSTLGPGDTVRIHPGKYHKQILISRSGTEAQPIRICGVADGIGNLPELNGSNATAKAGTNYGSTMQPYAGILIYDRNAAYYGGDVYPKNIIIEGLKITGFNKNNTFTSLTTGSLTNYALGATSIRVQHGGNITIRGNELAYCDNGLFTMSNNGVESNSTNNLLVEGNYFNGNGVDSSSTQHQSYLQSFGLVVQGNYYGDLIPTSTGGQLKTRSVQQFIRYNYFKTGARILDLVEVQDDWKIVFPWVGVDINEQVNITPNEVVYNYEAYQDKYVYGNIINNISTERKTAAWMVHGAGDNSQDGNSGGTLHFYHNTATISFINGHTSNWRSGFFDFGPYGTAITTHTVWPTARATNNAVYIEQQIPASGLCFFWNRYKGDRVILDKNWISTGWGTGNIVGGDGTGIGVGLAANMWQGGTVETQVKGTSNLITGATMPFNSATYIPESGSPLINSATSLPNEISNLPPLANYNLLTYRMAPRTTFNDIGALEYTDLAYQAAPKILNIK